MVVEQQLRREIGASNFSGVSSSASQQFQERRELQELLKQRLHTRRVLFHGSGALIQHKHSVKSNAGEG